MTGMQLGVQGLNAKAAAAPEVAVRLARLAEDLGYGSWWAAEHVVLPTGPGGPADATTPLVDPLIHLAHIAAVTSRIELGTAVIILPQRNPLVLAKQAASLDVLSGGRLLLGVGAGWLEPEMRAVGVPMSERGARSDEYLDAMTELWTSPAPAYSGRHVSFAGVDAHPRPVRAGGPRVHVGGRSPGAYRRAVARAHGFYGNGTVADIEGDLAGLRRAADQVERPARLGRLEITAMPLTEVDQRAADRYAGLGVDRLVVHAMPIDDPDDIAKFLERHAGLVR